MKIALVHHLLRGGAHRRVVEQLRCLPSGVAVQEFVIQGAEPVTENPIVIDYAPRALGSSSLMKPMHRYRDLSQLERAWSELCRSIEASDCNAIWANPCHELKIPPLTEALARRTVLYLDEPDRQYFDPSVKNATRRSTRPLYYALNHRKRTGQQRSMAKISTIATNSAFTASMIESAYGRTPSVIPLGVHDRFSPGDGDLVRHGALSVGTLIPSKGHDLAIRALSRVEPKLSLTVISPRGEASERERLEQLANACEVEVRFHLGVTDDELVAAYRSAAVTLYLAKAEPFGLVSIEAQASGSSVVLVNEGGLPETARDNPLAFITERDISSIAAGITKAIEGVDPQLRSDVAARVRAQWSWETSSRALLAALEQVATT